MNELEFKKRIEIYKRKYTIEVQPPECETCHEPAELYDTQEVQNYCEKCLIKSFIDDKDILISYTDPFTL